MTFPIVGVGASAGGLEAFTQLLGALPTDTGMAFVLIQHLDPTHASFLVEALGKATKMPVHQAENGQQVEPNHVYVIPPNTELGILHGALTLLPRHDEVRRLHLPVDFFFRALAADHGRQAIGVVLSGTGSDGTEGLKAIKSANGITFAQDPKSAKFDGMPHSAIDAGVVDYARPILELAPELVRLGHHPYLSRETAAPKNEDSTLKKIFVLVRNAIGVDFSEYKTATIERRMARRMALRQTEDVQQYLTLLQREPEEIRHLYEDVLIHVTSFFRDTDVFDSLKEQLLPEILRSKAEGAPIRAWVAGCSTGQEVYSLAILLLELVGSSQEHPIQIFGSDISEKAIEKARLGVFSDSAMREVSDERRRRYFNKTEVGYRVAKNVRDLCVFVRHDLARDPPFSKLDLISCRNVLIYFDSALQKRVLLTFHYALSQPGFLLLGRTENISGFMHLFSPTDKARKLFARMAGRSALQFAPRAEVHPPIGQRANAALAGVSAPTMDLGKHLDRALVARYSPPGVLINDRMEILQFRGETGAFLQPAPGEPQTNLLKMARAGLLGDLRTTIAKAKKTNAPAGAPDVQIDQDGFRRSCNIDVVPVGTLPGTPDHLFIVTFEEAAKAKRERPSEQRSPRLKSSHETGRAQRLERELAATKEYLQSLVDDHGRTNDELNAANEELVSGNEELQSMNEELETAKEELQSTNEELTTVNDELHSRNQEISVVNSDLVNLLSTVDVPILILDMSLRIRRFTPKARSILNVVPTDVGRPLDDIKVNLDIPNLHELISNVIESNTLHESEVRDRDGRWYRMQIRPYKTVDNKIDGATLSLVDINALKHHIAAAERAKADAERANVAKDQFLATLSHELRTPLSTMLMHAEMLQKVDDPKIKHAADAIERGTKNQVQLIDDLLDVSRIVTGKMKMETEPVDLAAVTRAAIEGVRAMIEKKKIEVAFAPDESADRVSGDSTRLQQVVSNLLTNALKFTPVGGRVTITLQQANGRAILRVKDTGIGIAPDFLRHVFNRFSQADGSNTRVVGGLGLGLAIVRHLVEAHGGTVVAESPGAGQGATFSVTLPLMTGPEETDGSHSVAATKRTSDNGPESRNQAETDAALKNLRILVVEDDRGMREAVAKMLSMTGATVRVAESANDAMKEVQAFRPEVLLCDIAMPGEDGYSFMRRLRATPEGHDLPALALTALASDEDRRRSFSAGFQMHVVKPVGIARLTRAVQQLLVHRAQ